MHEEGNIVLSILLQAAIVVTRVAGWCKKLTPLQVANGNFLHWIKIPTRNKKILHEGILIPHSTYPNVIVECELVNKRLCYKYHLHIFIAFVYLYLITRFPLYLHLFRSQIICGFSPHCSSVRHIVWAHKCLCVINAGVLFCGPWLMQSLSSSISI